MKNDNELKTLLPANPIQVGNKVLTVQPFPFVRLPQVMGIIKNVGTDVFSLLAVAGGSKQAEDGSTESNVDASALTIAADVIANHFDDVANLMAIYCRVEPETLKADDFTIEDAILVLATILTQHKSFFIQRLAPLTAKAN